MQPENEPEAEPGNENDGFENYLRQFQPRPPAPLPAAERVQPSPLRARLAVAALVLLACGLAILLTVTPEQLVERAGPPVDSATLLTDGTSSAQTASLGQLNRLLGEDPERLDAVLTEMSRHLLPNVERRDGSLWALGQE